MRIRLDDFCADGFVVVREAVAPDIVRSCVEVMEEKLRARGVDVRDPSTWTEPVVRIDTPFGPSFTAAGASPALYEVYDALLGPDRWVKKEGVGGTVPVRFPSARDPGDAGWHIDGSYDVDGAWWVNVYSRGRGLLALFLFSDVGEEDAPTELIVGSHLDVPRLLAPFGEQGAPGVGELPAATFERPRAFATGRAGDVFVCHPFIVHRATWPHRGSGPRMVAQPEVPLRESFALRPGAATCVVERTISKRSSRSDVASLGHVVVGCAAARVTGARDVTTRERVRWAVLLVALSLLPDVDVVAFAFGIPYAHPFGHRGASHSLAFALLVGLVAAFAMRGEPRERARAAIVITLVVASHPLLDAMTDGGLGVALFWPVSDARIFFPWRPLPVAPIGAGMLSARGAYVLAVEALWFAPLLVVAAWPRRSLASSRRNTEAGGE